MYCPYCGAELPDNSVFCKNCGQKLPVIESTESPKEDSTTTKKKTVIFIPNADEQLLLSTSGVHIKDTVVNLHLTNKRFVISSSAGILSEFALTSIIRFNQISNVINEVGISMRITSSLGERELRLFFPSMDVRDSWIQTLGGVVNRAFADANSAALSSQNSNTSPTTTVDNERHQITSASYSAPRTQEQHYSQSPSPLPPKKSSAGKVAAIIISISVVLGVCIGVACIIAGSSDTPSSGSSTPQDDGRVPVTITSEPSGATVTIAGNVYGTTPLTIRLYPSSSYMIRVEKSGYALWTIQTKVGTSDMAINATLTKLGNSYPTITPTKSPTKVPTVVPTKAPTAVPTKVPTPKPNPDKTTAEAIVKAIQPDNPYVRTLALLTIKEEHGGSYNMGQICDIFDYLYKNWTYVNDPRGSEYFAPASESAVLLKGDCDDFAILMASCIEAIGGGARVSLAKGVDGGHAYAEVLFAKNQDEASDKAQSLSRRYNGELIHYRANSEKTAYWLNLDWFANHPGGKYFENVEPILIVYPDGYYERVNIK